MHNIITIFNSFNHFLACPELPDLPCLENGEEVLEYYSFSANNLHRNIFALIILYIGFHILGYLALLKSSRKL